MLIKHENLVGKTVHVAHAFEYPNRVTRNAATGFNIEDIGRLCIQLDTGGYWRLLSVEPTVWTPAYGNTMFQRLQAEEVTNITYNESDKVTRIDYGNSIYCTIEYTLTGKAEFVAFFTPLDTLIEKWEYSYDEQSRLTGVTQLN